MLKGLKNARIYIFSCQRQIQWQHFNEVHLIQINQSIVKVKCSEAATRGVPQKDVLADSPIFTGKHLC